MCIYDVCKLPTADKGSEMVKKSENYAYVVYGRLLGARIVVEATPLLDAKMQTQG